VVVEVGVGMGVCGLVCGCVCVTGLGEDHIYGRSCGFD
jgi:hypothetical protein